MTCAWFCGARYKEGIRNLLEYDATKPFDPAKRDPRAKPREDFGLPSRGQGIDKKDEISRREVTALEAKYRGQVRCSAGRQEAGAADTG